MDPATLTATTSLGGACTGSIQISADDFTTCLPFSSTSPTMTSGNTIATLTAAPELSLGQTFKIRVTTAAHDAGGQAITAFTQTTGFTTATAPLSGVVISQVYGAGGNSGATYNQDFIELHNRGAVAVDLTGWSVQYASSGGNSWTVTTLSGSIQAGGYYLISESTTGANGIALPTTQASGPSAMSGSSAKVALASSTTALTGACPTGGALVDLVGYGTAASTCPDSGTPTANLSATLAALRAGSGCADTNASSTDFATGTPAPRNSATAALVCTGGPVQNETNAALEADYCNIQFPTSLNVQTGMSSGNVYGRVYEPTVTDTGMPPAATLVGQLGYGPQTSNPEIGTGWTWTAASYNVNFGNDAEFMASFTAPAVGSYAYAYRFSLDSGATWTVCDLNGAGSNPGLAFETPQVGLMTVTP
jgi:hypothetical protein